MAATKKIACSSQFPRGRDTHATEGTLKNTWAGQKAKKAWGKCGQEILLWLPWEGKVRQAKQV